MYNSAAISASTGISTELASSINLSMKSLTLSFILIITPCLTMADSPKEFLDCGLEAEIAMRVVNFGTRSSLSPLPIVLLQRVF